MGVRGPVPKRENQRVRRNKAGEDGITTEKITAIGAVEVPELELGVETHYLIRAYWESLTESAQAQYYEPSDWQHARLTLYVLNDMLISGKIGSMKLAEVNKMLSALLVTEGDRRRVRLEVERESAGQQLADVAQLFRDRLAQ